MLFFICEVLCLLVNDVFEGEAHLRVLLVLRLTLKQQLVQCFEVLRLLQVQLVGRA